MKKAIVFTSFGVLDANSRRMALDATADLLSERFPDYLLVQAFTSVFIKKALAKQGLVVDSLPEVLDRLKDSHYDVVIIQPSHLTPGEEYDNKVLKVARSYEKDFAQLIVGEPVLATEADDEPALRAILQYQPLAPQEELVLIGHGSPHHHNPVYERMQAKADALHLPVTIGVLEPTDTPSYDMVVQRLRDKKVKELLLAPLLLSAGRHVTVDIAGNDENSWQSRLECDGFTVRTDLQSLGENPAFRELYVQKLQQAAAQLNGCK